MTDEQIPPAARRLIIERIDSVAQLEILLRLMGGAEGGSPSDVAAALRLEEKWTAWQMARMASSGLLARSEGVYRFAPDSAAIADAARDLARAYADRRVAVIALIYAKPPDHVRAFSDAFRLRSDDPDKESGRG